MRYVTSIGKVLLLLIVGLVLAFFSVFNVIFTDKHSQSDYIVGLILVCVTFFIISGMAALLMHSWRFPLWLMLPSILVLVEYSLQESQQIRYHLAVFVMLVFGTAVGVAAGTRLRDPNRARALDSGET